MVFEKTLENPLDCKEIQPVNPKGNQSWILIGRTDVEVETPILWPHDVKNWLVRKDPDAGRDWGREEKGTTEDEMAEWHHWLDGHEFEQALGAGEGQGSLACYSPRGCKELYMTEWLDWTGGEQYEDFFREKNRNKTTIWPNNLTMEHTPWENDNWKRHMYPNVHWSTIYNS